MMTPKAFLYFIAFNNFLGPSEENIIHRTNSSCLQYLL